MVSGCSERRMQEEAVHRQRSLHLQTPRGGRVLTFCRSQGTGLRSRIFPEGLSRTHAAAQEGHREWGVPCRDGLGWHINLPHLIDEETKTREGHCPPSAIPGPSPKLQPFTGEPQSWAQAACPSLCGLNRPQAAASSLPSVLAALAWPRPGPHGAGAGVTGAEAFPSRQGRQLCAQALVWELEGPRARPTPAGGWQTGLGRGWACPSPPSFLQPSPELPFSADNSSPRALVHAPRGPARGSALDELTVAGSLGLPDREPGKG